MAPFEPLRSLRQLERIRTSYGDGVAARKLALLSQLAQARFGTATQVERLHEVLCFLRAYPDDARVLATVTRLLERFDQRADLRRHAAALADTGIAGTAIHYRFFWSTAKWLATRWPAQLTLGRDDDEAAANLDRSLALIAPAAAAEWFNAGALPACRRSIGCAANAAMRPGWSSTSPACRATASRVKRLPMPSTRPSCSPPAATRPRAAAPASPARRGRSSSGRCGAPARTCGPPPQ
jgi:hypothetical protein